MPTNDERREVARRLRVLDYSDLKESLICAYLDALGIEGYADWVGIAHRLADLIEPESVQTCQMIEQHDWGDEWEPYGIYCSKCHEFVPQWKSRSKAVLNGDTDIPLPNYCPNCGAKVVIDDE